MVLSLAYEDRLKRELALEDESIEESRRKYHEALYGRPATPTKKAKGPTPLAELPPGLALLHKAVGPFIKAIYEFKESPYAGGRLKDTRKFLNQFGNEELAFIVARRLISSIGESRLESIQSLAISLCSQLQDELHLKLTKIQFPGYMEVIAKNFKTSDEAFKRIVSKHSWNKMNKWIEECPLAKFLGYRTFDEMSYSLEGQTHVGVKLIDLFIESTGLVEKAKKHSNNVKERIYYLRASDLLLEQLAKAHSKCEVLQPLNMAMVVTPVDWTGVYGGGYLNNALTHRHSLIKQRDKSIVERYKDIEMPNVYKAVNALQHVPWRINKKVFDVMNELHKTNARVAGLPGENEEPLPPFPWGEITKAEFKAIKEQDPDGVREWKQKRHTVHERNARNRSKRTAMSTKLEVARKLIAEPEIFFCYELDWRGRIYAIQNFLNPQSDDSGKALLEFANGKPLGERGVFWLKVHLANEYDKDPEFSQKGLSKLPFKDRTRWVEVNEEKILDSARNPLDGQRFWMKADHPFLFLAACFEYLGYKEQGEGFISHVPVGVDGSCNGLQNFSAMLKDEVGGKSTNLLPGEFPEDVYNDVLDRVLEKMAKAASFGDRMAKALNGKIDRDILKTPVMTYVYNVSEYGMRDQILKKLNDRDNDQVKYLDVDNFEAAKYIAELTFESIGEIVVAAREAMDWLKKVAKISAKAGLAISWTTPIGFKPIQEYHKSFMKRIRTFFGGISLPLAIRKDTDKLDSVKQVNGIAPNVVHSFDASHLMLTVNECVNQGITDFAAIHDSYGTHACNVDNLGEILRNMFILQYSEDVLAKFRDEVVKQLPAKEAKKIPELPKQGGLNLSLIRESQYFFA